MIRFCRSETTWLIPPALTDANSETIINQAYIHSINFINFF